MSRKARTAVRWSPRSRCSPSPWTRRRSYSPSPRPGAAPPLRELGQDTATGKPIVLKEGRFGPYVTDGETNASLRKGDTVEDITTQRAIELLAERRAAAPAPRKRPAARPAARSS